jgi:hypothetical protein
MNCCMSYADLSSRYRGKPESSRITGCGDSELERLTQDLKMPYANRGSFTLLKVFQCTQFALQ